MTDIIIIKQTEKFRIEGSFSSDGDTQTYKFNLYVYVGVDADLNYEGEYGYSVEVIKMSPFGATWEYENDAIGESGTIPDFAEFKPRFDAGTPENMLEVFDVFPYHIHGDCDALFEETEEHC